MPDVALARPALLLLMVQLVLSTWMQGALGSNHSTFHQAARSPFDCKHIDANGFIFGLSGLPSPVTVKKAEDTPPTTTTTSIQLSLCQNLDKETGPASDQCPPGTRICMKVSNEKKGEPDRLIQVIAAGGSESGNWPWTAELGERLEGAERALELEMHGEPYAHRTQRTEIDLKCDRNAAKDNKPTMKKYDREDGKLKLEWVTPHACAKEMPGAGQGGGREGNEEPGRTDEPASTNSGGWGFFSWFFFFIFVGLLAYFAIGFWRNYNEYGVIELPNKDFWREAPYIAKDMGKHIYSTVSGHGTSRGAYEPV